MFKTIRTRLGLRKSKFLDKLPIEFCQHTLSLVLLRRKFDNFEDIEGFQSREELWSTILRKYYNNDKITFLEFGVHEGYSINYFASRNSNPKSSFVGFDGFVGYRRTGKVLLLKKGSLIKKGSHHQRMTLEYHFR